MKTIHKKYRVAIIDDEQSIKKTITYALQPEGYKIDAYENGSQALKVINECLPDVIILDILMPGIDGITFCSLFRKDHPDIPIIFLSSKVDELTKIEALERGGDDYLTKPFSIKELLTRIKVCLRRVELYQSNKELSDTTKHEIIDYGLFRVNYSTWEVFVNNQIINFSVTEFRILTTLLSNPGIVFTREKLMLKAYPEDLYISDRNVDMHITRIRKKISKYYPNFESIETVYGLGYRYKEKHHE
jgi:two-component system OmpR family response regulator/two-component system response regulator ChvI